MTATDDARDAYRSRIRAAAEAAASRGVGERFLLVHALDVAELLTRIVETEAVPTRVLEQAVEIARSATDQCTSIGGCGAGRCMFRVGHCGPHLGLGAAWTGGSGDR